MGIYFLCAAVLIRTCIDLSFKLSVNQLHIDSMDRFFENAKQVLGSYFLWIGIGLSLVNMVVWSLCLSKFELSYAYPLYSISYVFIILAGKLFFKEHLDRNKIIGMLFIITGAVLLVFI